MQFFHPGALWGSARCILHANQIKTAENSVDIQYDDQLGVSLADSLDEFCPPSCP